MKTILLFAVFVCGVLCTDGPALAGSRSSARYAVPADVSDAAGQRASSASYTQDGSVGGIGGISSVSSPAETSKGGYIGQLYEITGLMLAASPTNVYSGSNSQLSAVAQVDDASKLALAGNQVVWSIVSGPIASIDTNGVLTAGIVSQNTAATAGGSALGQFGTVQLTVLVVGGGTPSSPKITHCSLSGTNIVISGNNGVTNGTYHVLTSTNVALPLTNWASLSTNTFDASGNFSFSNGVAGGPPRQFYILSVP